MDTLQVVAEPRRRKILSLIWSEERSASEIADQFDVTFGAISQHLAILKEAELVTVRKDGNRRIYRADHDRLAPYAPILEQMWGESLSRLAEAVERGEAK